MPNIIIAIHQGFLDNVDMDLNRIQSTLKENGVTIKNLRKVLAETQKPLATIRQEIVKGNHFCEENLQNYELADLIEDYALLLTPRGVACVSNSLSYTCAFRYFYNYYFLFFPDENDSQTLVFTEIKDESDTTSLSMKEIYEMLCLARSRSDDNPFAIFDDCRCEVV